MADDFYSLKGFISYGALTNNQPGIISPVGELSLRSGTFAKDRTHYTRATDTSPPTSAELVCFNSRSVAGQPIAVPAQISALILEIANWAYVEAVDGTFTSSTDSFRTPLLAEFGDRIEDISIGAMVAGGGIWLPGSLTFFGKASAIFGGTPPAGMEELRVRVWFADDEFRRQYDEYHIEFVAPVDDLDDLFGNPVQVGNLLRQMTPPVLDEKVRELVGNSPYTSRRSYNFNYHHLGNPTQTTPAYWTFVIWSDYGDNIDTLKKELVEWILDNSTHTREEWAEIFPDIFASTEFILMPLWNQYAIPNLTLNNAMYSPTVLMTDAQEMIKAVGVGTSYTEAHVVENSTFMSMPWKSIAMVAVGGPENREEKFKIFEVLPDYIAVPTSSIDFERMSESTKFWSQKMFAMLIVAENMTEFSDVPAGMSRLKRTNTDGDEIMYLVSSVNDIQYLVVSKQSLNSMFPPLDRTAPPLEFTPDPSVALTTPLGSKHLQLNVSVSGGTPPYQFSATSGDIEQGGQIDPDTGFLDVTFREWGTNRIDVTVEDSKGFPATAAYTVVSTED